MFRYFGDYPELIQDGSQRLLEFNFVKKPLSALARVMDFNTPDAAWLAARIVVFVSFSLNFFLLCLFLNIRIGYFFVALALGTTLLSSILSPFGFTELRSVLYDFTNLFSQAYLILIVYPVWRLSELIDQKKTG
ncbi:MAG: hypothetical protein RIC35_09180 [Marinoscillum sp.]